MLPRADVRDRLIGESLDGALPQGARVGTSSPRRSAQVRRLRADIEIVLFRGNVDTRLEQAGAGRGRGDLLPAPGSTGSAAPISAMRSRREMLPAPAQGAVGIETLAVREDIRGCWARSIMHRPILRRGRTRACWPRLGADCRSPVAALAVRSGAGLLLRAEILTEDGSECRSGEAMLLRTEDAAALAHRLLESASPRLRTLFTGA
jgi:hydroxymethylbilane synthase